jgi:glucose-1-phosphatase
MNNSIKAVIFDVGGVLIRTHDWSSRQAWEARLELPPGGADAIVFHSEMGQRAQRGELSDEALWSWIGKELALDEDLNAFRAAFWAGDRLDEALVQFIRDLRPVYQTAIISNATDALLENLTVHYPMADAFDLIVGSAYEQVMKPESEIYITALERLGRLPEETVFIDDAPANIAAARDLGMYAIQFAPDIDVRRVLREQYGVKSG